MYLSLEKSRNKNSGMKEMPGLCTCTTKEQVKNLEDFSYANPQCFSTLKEKTQPYVGGKGQLFTVDYVPMVPLLSGKPTFKSAISLFYPRLRLASFVPMGLHSPASLPKAYKWKENCPWHFPGGKPKVTISFPLSSAIKCSIEVLIYISTFRNFLYCYDVM